MLNSAMKTKINVGLVLGGIGTLVAAAVYLGNSQQGELETSTPPAQDLAKPTIALDQGNVGEISLKPPPAETTPSVAAPSVSANKDDPVRIYREPLPPAPAWYNTAIIEVSKSSLDTGVDPLLGVRTRKLKKKVNGAVLKLKFRNTARCVIGDLDIIENDLKNDTAADLILTLEELGGKGGNIAGKARLTLDEIKGKGLVSLDLSTAKSPAVFGLYICKDSERVGRCSQKTIVIPGSTEKEVFQSQKPQDNVYFFAPVILDGDSISFVRQSLKEPLYYPKLAEYIGKRLGSVDSAEQITRVVQAINETILSATVQVEGSEAVIDLPKSDVSSCEELYGRSLRTK